MTVPSPLDAGTHFFTLTELAALSLAELQTLWESVSVEEQAYLVRVFEREADKRQIVEDLDESRMARYFLEQYLHIGFVPAGDVWVKVPPAVREQYRQALVEQEPTERAAPIGSQPKTPSSSLRWIMLLAVPVICLVVFALMRVASGSGSRSTPRLSPTPTLTATVTPTPTPTATPLPPTATPFALTGFDAAITAGERVSRDYYPVQLQIFADPNTPPRVFIVQQQAVQLADWVYDSSPDVVSWLRGMTIRPVLGVPFSQSNLDLFRSLNTASELVVTMNTGDVWQFFYLDTEQVGRSDTTLFRQTEPGLTLVLIGETFADGAPTDLRYVVRAAYPTEQELSALSETAPRVLPAGTPYTLNGLTLTVRFARLMMDPALPSEMAYAVVEIDLLTGDADIAVTDFAWQLELPTLSGERFAVDPTATHGTCPALPPLLPADTATCASLVFLVPHTATDARLWVGIPAVADTAFALTLDTSTVNRNPANLNVQIRRISYTNTTLTVETRLYNPTDTEMTVSAADFGLVLGFVPNPTGTTLTPLIPEQTIASGNALDLTLNFPYAGEGYATLTLLERVWGVEVKHS
jgi:hypothetical protein